VIKGKAPREGCSLILDGLWFLLSRPGKLVERCLRPKPETYQEIYTEKEISQEIERIAVDECPEFQQYFPITSEMGIGVECIEFCPDEKVVIRILGEQSFSKQYRRQVYTTKGDKYFKLNNKIYHLKSKVRPLDPIQAKK
jgi:hypothetical protein